MPPSPTSSVGGEGHTESIAVASIAPAPHAAVVALGHLGTRQGDSETLRRRWQSTSPPLVFVSAAGPCGSWRSRARPPPGQGCWGVAPSFLPQTSGERVTPTRRDARTLARLMRAGALPPVSGPTGEEAAMRDLRRAREAVLRARQPAPCRLPALRLRQA